jgi:hypothetical protein
MLARAVIGTIDRLIIMLQTKVLGIDLDETERHAQARRGNDVITSSSSCSAKGLMHRHSAFPARGRNDSQIRNHTLDEIVSNLTP